jgi:transcriptional/translational regulatory protein YebC/TACO1
MFDNIGQFHFAPGADEEALMEVAIEVGAEDVETAEDGSIEVTTDPGDFLTVKEALLDAGFEPEMSELGMVAQNLTELDPDASEKVIRLIDHLDDVQNVYTNAAFSDE